MEEAKKRGVGTFDVVYLILLVALIVLAVFFMGKPRVGVLDLPAVAVGVGMESRIKTDAELGDKQATDELKKLQQSFVEKDKALRSALAAAAAEKDKQKIQQELTEATQDYYRQSIVIRRTLARHRQAVMRTFRARLQPFITEVARKRRLWEVHDRSLGVLYAIGQVDITDEVIKKAAPFFREQKELVGVEESLGAGATNAVGDEAVDEPEP